MSFDARVMLAFSCAVGLAAVVLAVYVMLKGQE